MVLNKYLVLSHKEEYDPVEGIISSVQPKVVQGFTRANIKEGLGVVEGWEPLGNDQDKLYFFPGCSVPRFKVREHYSCTIKPANATAAFVSKTELMGSDSTLDFYNNLMPIDFVNLTSFLNEMTDQASAKLIESIARNIDNIFLDTSLWKHKPYSNEFGNTRLYDVLTHSTYSHKTESLKPEYNLLGFRRTSPLSECEAPIYFEDELLSVLNKDNFIIDEEKYEELRSFGLTEDKENEVLMMELMSNCDFEKSLVYLLFLLKEFGLNIQPYKESNHVNFKSLLSFLSLNHSDLSRIELTAMTRTLKSHKQFTRKNAARLSGLFAGSFIDYSLNENQCWTEGPVLKSNLELNNETNA